MPEDRQDGHVIVGQGRIERLKEMAATLRAAGLNAEIVSPPRSDPNA